MTNNVRVLVKEEFFTQIQQSDETIINNSFEYNEENFHLLINENVALRRKIEKLQDEIILLYKNKVLDLPPNLNIVHGEAT